MHFFRVSTFAQCRHAQQNSVFGANSGDSVARLVRWQVSPWLSLVFVLYIAVATLAIMNVVTGVFVDSVLASAKVDKELPVRCRGRGGSADDECTRCVVPYSGFAQLAAALI